MYECKKSDQYDTADVPTFEEVALYQRQPNEKYRLIILVGKYRLFVKLHPTFFFFFFSSRLLRTFAMMSNIQLLHLLIIFQRFSISELNLRMLEH